MFWGPGFTKVAAGDLNGDGLTDFVIYRPTDGTSYTAVSNGDGTFHYQYTLVNGGYTHVVVHADFHAVSNRKADVFFCRSTDGLAYVGISNGTGGFTFSPVSLTAGYTFVQIGRHQRRWQSGSVAVPAAPRARRSGGIEHRFELPH